MGAVDFLPAPLALPLLEILPVDALFATGDPIVAKGLHKEKTVGDGGRAAADDAKYEISKITGIPPNDVDPTDDEVMLEEDTNGGDDGLWVYLVMLGVGLFVYNSVDVNVNLLAF